MGPAVNVRWPSVSSWVKALGLDQSSQTAAANAVDVQKATLNRDTYLKKIASEEYELVDGVTLQPSRSSTLQRGVNVSHSLELLGEAGLDLGVKATIGARVTDLLADEIREETSTGMAVNIDGSVWERVCVDWYARVRSGKVILRARGATHELPFECTVGFQAKVVGLSKRRHRFSDEGGSETEDHSTLRIPKSSASSLAQPMGCVTTLSKEQSDLFEARFETAPRVEHGDKLPVYRGGMNARCMGYCEVVAVRGSRIVGRCDGFRPKVGDSVCQLAGVHGLDQAQ
jgi:hypothetical protein